MNGICASGQYTAVLSAQTFQARNGGPGRCLTPLLLSYYECRWEYFFSTGVPILTTTVQPLRLLPGVSPFKVLSFPTQGINWLRLQCLYGGQHAETAVQQNRGLFSNLDSMVDPEMWDCSPELRYGSTLTIANTRQYSRFCCFAGKKKGARRPPRVLLHCLL